MRMGMIRVLLADDHAIVRSGIRRMIEQIPNMEVAGEAEKVPRFTFSDSTSIEPG